MQIVEKEIGKYTAVFSRTDDGWAYRIKFVNPDFSKNYPTYDQARESAIWKIQDLMAEAK